ncbi:fasciclin domain-containing protein [Altererythrobacter epoxidivorans]|uniref:fasciclin domain-containing protein n=1 Tax=Altererythrobacter epoxidivorans TaxID=361183 RepID=UPI0009F8D1AD|nr:fasciclin domain-containing protein [Altererythrobacter epoxidivorans]
MIRHKLRPTLAAIAALSLVTLSACSEEPAASDDLTTQERTSQTVAAIVGERSDLSILSDELSDSGLSAIFDGQASYTVLAPLDTAFEGMEGGTELLSDETKGALVAAILREHMVPGALSPEAIREAIADNGGPVTVRSFGEGDLNFALEGDKIVVTGPNGTKATMAGGALVGSNGVVIPIDGVLATIPGEA